MAKETPTKAVIEPIYNVSEISPNAPRLFGVSSDLAAAAFYHSHTTCCTLTEARVIIKTFAERKVN